MTLAAKAFASILVAATAVAPPASPTSAPPASKPATPETPGTSATPPEPPAKVIPAVPPSTAPDSPLPRVLVFSRTAGFRHDSIPAGVAAIKDLGAGLFAVDTTEDSAAFTKDNLKKYRAVVFLSSTGDVLNNDQQAAFESFIRAGGGYAGVHGAADMEYDWAWYGKLMGAYFNGHPEIQPATIMVEDAKHRSTRHLPKEWTRTDEYYTFKSNPRGETRILASLLEASYKPGSTAMGDHPIAWYHEFDGGRAWYTALGHTIASFSEPEFRQHLREGIAWAANLPDSPSPATPDSPKTPPQPKLPDTPAKPR